jgi:2-polyprenyl-3-methyl-5-hydroxy-6-metoxy-1,4-benzoquinol methylase
MIDPWNIVKSTIMSFKNRIKYTLMYLLPGQLPWDTGISPPELMTFIGNNPPGKALDLGCGTGTNAITLAQHGWQVTGIDFARQAIHSARRKARKAGLQIDFRVADVSQLQNLPSPFDLILDIGCFHSLSAEERTEYTTKLEHHLAPAGTYMAYVFFRNPGEVGPGLIEEDVQALSDRFQLIDRQDGSERGVRPSTWLLLQKKRS